MIVTKVNPEILSKYQRLPENLTKESELENLFEQRYNDINNFETFLTNNGFKIIKFFLNVSKKEQKRRFLDRFFIFLIFVFFFFLNFFFFNFYIF